jgi:hypothetical protein
MDKMGEQIKLLVQAASLGKHTHQVSSSEGDSAFSPDSVGSVYQAGKPPKRKRTRRRSSHSDSGSGASQGDRYARKKVVSTKHKKKGRKSKHSSSSPSSSEFPTSSSSDEEKHVGRLEKTFKNGKDKLPAKGLTVRVRSAIRASIAGSLSNLKPVETIVTLANKHPGIKGVPLSFPLKMDSEIKTERRGKKV